MTHYTAVTGINMRPPSLPILDAIARTAFPANPYQRGTQNWRLWERLRQGPVTNVEIVRVMGIFNSTGRISEVRQALFGTGWTVETRRIDGGVFEYSVRRSTP